MEEKITSIKRLIEWKNELENDLEYFEKNLLECESDSDKKYYSRNRDICSFKLSIIDKTIDSMLK